MSRRTYRISVGVCVLVILASAASVVQNHWPRQDARQTRHVAPGSGFVALPASKVYHAPGCGYLNRADANSFRHFPTTAAAEENGLRPCRACLGR